MNFGRINQIRKQELGIGARLCLWIYSVVDILSELITGVSKAEKLMVSRNIAEALEKMYENRRRWLRIIDFISDCHKARFDFATKDLELINRVEKAFRVKKESKRFLAIMDSLTEIRDHQLCVDILNEHAAIKMDKFGEEEKSLLIQIWNQLNGLRHKNLSKFEEGRFWIDIGFQGENPLTDFRGAGLLGLLNLHYFVTELDHKVPAKIVYDISQEQSTQFFFACAGINLTFSLLQEIKKFKFFTFFSETSSTGRVLNKFDMMYSVLFEDFGKYFTSHPNHSDLMSFNIIFTEYMKEFCTKQHVRGLLNKFAES